MIRHTYYLMLCITMLSAACFLESCRNSEDNPKKDYLICVGSSMMTVHEFDRAFEIAKTAYPYDITKEPEVLQEARMQLLRQMTERMILLERARELQLEISDTEFQKALSEIRKDYSDEDFKQMLLETAISYQVWAEELKIRLLMEKVVARELKAEIRITSDDITAYYKKHQDKIPPGTDTTEIPEVVDEALISQLRQKKTEKAYQTLIRRLREKYVIEIKENQWAKGQ